MADAYWRFADGRVQAPVHLAAAAAANAPVPVPVPAPASAAVKRPLPDYPDMPAGPEYAGYIPREEERMPHHMVVRDTESIAASYDLYLRNGHNPFGAGETGRPLSGGMPIQHVGDTRLVGVGGVDNRNIAYGGGRSEMALPPDASNTLFVEGLPANCTRREVAHIFRPFVGFREVRLVTKESKHPGGDPLVLCFTDFSTPSQAAIALEALQGYRFDEHDRESANLRLEFARFPGPRSGGGPRGRR